MIASSSTIRALLIATLAVVGSANDNESSTLLRGNSIKQAQTQEAVDVDVDERRNLVALDMTIGLGDMICKEHPRKDGSVVCSFRTMPPTDLVSNTIQKDCLYTTTSNSNFCLATQVNRVPFNYQIPEAPEASDATQDVIDVVRNCPGIQPNTGLACSTYIPLGVAETSCTYGQMKCNCNLKNNDRSIAVGWDCGQAPEDTNGSGVTQPTIKPDIVIDLDLNDAEVISPQINQNQIVANIRNPASCPKLKPDTGDSCDWGQRCHYYEKDVVGNVIASLYCDCGNNCNFTCRPQTFDQSF